MWHNTVAGKKHIHPKLTLVGAGPGDPELITAKGIKALASADVVLYDALANEELLSYCPAHTVKVFVGKRANMHSHIQNEINRLIVEYAFSHGHVVRLKGGDPFVFGRGFEEMEYAESFGIETAIVPGVSSAFAVPVLQRIPLTSRNVSDSFWVLTGTTKEGELSKDLQLAAKSNATVIILMGTRKLKEITELFIKNNKGNTPVAIVQNGSLPTQKVAVGTVFSILQIAEKEKVGSPAIIVIGDVVNALRQVDMDDLLLNEIHEGRFLNVSKNYKK